MLGCLKHHGSCDAKGDSRAVGVPMRRLRSRRSFSAACSGLRAAKTAHSSESVALCVCAGLLILETGMGHHGEEFQMAKYSCRRSDDGTGLAMYAIS